MHPVAQHGSMCKATFLCQYCKAGHQAERLCQLTWRGGGSLLKNNCNPVRLRWLYSGRGHMVLR